MRSQLNIASGRCGGYMRALVILAAAAVAGCSGMTGQEQSLAECKLENHEARGVNFQKNYVGDNLRSEPKEDQAYNAFLISCMEAKGYTFAAPLDDAGNLNENCWLRDASGGLQSMPWAGGPSCFSR